MGYSQKTDSIEEASVMVEDFPDVAAEFPGGRSAMMMYILENAEYPPLKQWECWRPAKIYITFIVMSDGWIGGVEVLRGFTEEYDQAAVKMVENMPRWIPAIKSGNNVNSRVRLPIQFEIW